MLAQCGCRQPLLLPWAIAAVTLAGLGCWDLLARGGGIDFILVGLAAYELLVGLTEEPAGRRRDERVPRQISVAALEAGLASDRYS